MAEILPFAPANANGVSRVLLAETAPTADSGERENAAMIKSVSRNHNGKRDRLLKMRAMHVVSQLPEDPAEARQILAYAIDIVDRFMTGESPPKPHLKGVGSDD